MQECASIGQVHQRSEEGEPPGVVQSDQPRKSRRNSLPSTRTGSRKAGREETHRLSPSAMPPPGTIMCKCGWWVIADPQVWSTAVMPMRAEVFWIGCDRQHRLS